MTIKPVSWWLGRRFITNFVVRTIADGAENDPERVVTVDLMGDRAEIGLGELQTLVESGLVVEAKGNTEGRA